MIELDVPPWSVHLGTAGCTCIRFACDRARDGDPWLLSRVVSELTSAGAFMADRPRAVGSGHGMPLIHSQLLSWWGTDVELESHHLRDDEGDEVSITLPSWDELTTVVPSEATVWELVDTVAAAILPRFGIIGDGEPIGATQCETAAGMRQLLLRHVGIVKRAYSPAVSGVDAHRYRVLPRSGMVVLIR